MEVLVLVGLVAVIILTVIVIYNNIIKRMNAVARAWTDVVVQERQKNNVLPSLEKIASGYEEYEATIMTQITRLRADLGVSLDIENYCTLRLFFVHQIYDTETRLTGSVERRTDIFLSPLLCPFFMQ